MKKLLTFLLLLGSTPLLAQTAPETVAASYFKEAEQVAKGQKLWKAGLYGPVLFVEPKTRRAWSNTADSAGILKPAGTVFTGIIPQDVSIANTAIRWQGRKWTVVLWPLPQQRDERLSLILHELFHRIQEELGFPANNPNSAHLDTRDGRVYFLLELEALKRAMQQPVKNRKENLAAALQFRQKRGALFPESFGNERLLEMSEGIAEYTGTLLGRDIDSIPGFLNRVITAAAGKASLMRSFAYTTGPLYGYLLYQKEPKWTYSLTAADDLPAQLAEYYGIRGQQTDEARLERLAVQYGAEQIRASEQAKQDRRDSLRAGYMELFTQKPVLRIKLSTQMKINFNPGNLFDLGTYGTVYPTAEVRDHWGHVQVDGGGMLLKDWNTITLSLDREPGAGEQVIEGKGWKLTLNTGWSLVKSSERQYSLLKKE